MKKISFYTLLISCFLFACESEETKVKPVEKQQEINVKKQLVEVEKQQEITSYYGVVKFSKSVNFVAQQAGIVSKLTVQPGQLVSKGQLIAMYQPINHQLEIDQAIIKYNKALEDYQRQKKLFESGAVTKTSVEDLESSLYIHEKIVQQLKQVNVIRAPFDGTITQVLVTKGQEVLLDAPIVSMANTEIVDIDFYVPVKEIDKIHVNDKVFVTNKGQKLSGKITKKSIQLDDKRKAYLITATCNNTNINVSGSTIPIMVRTGKVITQIKIPAKSLKSKNNEHYVFLGKGNKATKQIVTIGNRNAKTVVVIKGLKIGDTLITAGAQKLKDNDIIKIIN